MQHRGAGLEVKRVIGALRRMLAAAGLEPVPAPEAFRRAKYGGAGAEEEDQFWRLLSSFVQTAGIVPPEGPGGWRWPACGRAGSPPPRGPLGGAGGCCWPWAGCWGGGALEGLLGRRLEGLDPTLLGPGEGGGQPSGGLRPDPASLRRLQWLLGSLRQQSRMLLASAEERSRALHAVLSFSPPASSVRSSAALQEDCAGLQNLCELLGAYLSWREVEGVFWTWMDSVMDQELTAPPMGGAPAPGGPPQGCRHAGGGLQRLDQVLLRLQPPDVGSGPQTRTRGTPEEPQTLKMASGVGPPPPDAPLPAPPGAGGGATAEGAVGGGATAENGVGGGATAENGETASGG
ncbi:uncharacterized protein tedc1 [Menidia menidia]